MLASCSPCQTEEEVCLKLLLGSTLSVVWGALRDIADTQVDDLLQTDQSVNEEYCPAAIL